MYYKWVIQQTCLVTWNLWWEEGKVRDGWGGRSCGQSRALVCRKSQDRAPAVPSESTFRFGVLLWTEYSTARGSSTWAPIVDVCLLFYLGNMVTHLSLSAKNRPVGLAKRFTNPHFCFCFTCDSYPCVCFVTAYANIWGETKQAQYGKSIEEKRHSSERKICKISQRKAERIVGKNDIY
jgi:hypothetical protein